MLKTMKEHHLQFALQTITRHSSSLRSPFSLASSPLLGLLPSCHSKKSLQSAEPKCFETRKEFSISNFCTRSEISSFVSSDSEETRAVEWRRRNRHETKSSLQKCPREAIEVSTRADCSLVEFISVENEIVNIKFVRVGVCRFAHGTSSNGIWMEQPRTQVRRCYWSRLRLPRNSSRWRSVESERWEMRGDSKSYYLHRAVEAGADVGCAGEGFPMVWRQSRWIGRQAIAKTNRSIKCISNRNFFRGFCCCRRWTWTIAAIHANGFLSHSSSSLFIDIRVYHKLFDKPLLFFNCTMCGVQAKSGEKDFSRQVSEQVFRSCPFSFASVSFSLSIPCSF